jgi:hypothetical protein
VADIDVLSEYFPPLFPMHIVLRDLLTQKP